MRASRLAIFAAFALVLPGVQAVALPEIWGARGAATWVASELTCEGALDVQAIGPIPAGPHAGHYQLTIDASSTTSGCEALHREGWIGASPREDGTHLLGGSATEGAMVTFSTDDAGARSILLLDWRQTPDGEAVRVLTAPIAENDGIL